MRRDKRFEAIEGQQQPDEREVRFVTRWPFFYGWVIMAAGTIGIIMTSPGQTYTVSIFIESIIEDLGISRSAVSTLYSVGTLVGSFTLPFWGRQVDRRGSRTIVTLVTVLFGLSCIFMGFVQNAVMLGFGFVLIRMLGQGALGLVSQNVINQWWMRRRGLVMGISGLFLAMLGMGAFPNLVYALISAFDWRIAYGILGLSLLLIMAPIGLLFFRNRPEDYQLSPDGLPSADADGAFPSVDPVTTEENWTLEEALRTRAFWIFTIGVSLFTLLTTGQFFHLVSIFADQGLGPSVAASVYLPVSVSAALATLLGGYLADRAPLRFLLTGGLIMQAVSLIMALFLEGTFTVLMFGILLGITNGIFRVVSTVAWPAFFGREHLGSIFGFTSAAGVVGAALGPLPFGYVHDQIGSYEPVLWATAGISIALALVALSVQKPKKLFERDATAAG